MRLTRHRTRRKNVELNLTSMIDVIFLLLIFFIVNTGSAGAERELLTALQIQAAAGKRANVEPVVVEIVEANGTFQYKVGSRSAADTTALTELLRQIPSKANGAFVKVNDDTPFVAAASAVQAAYDAGYFVVNYIPVGHK